VVGAGVFAHVTLSSFLAACVASTIVPMTPTPSGSRTTSVMPGICAPRVIDACGAPPEYGDCNTAA
jgi:hypothetical protein